ncbi:hypothetical protein BDV96DRAFT_504815 [Lophiotrema nucula]|uniref:Uncharacterized protein n=1 Tax=Lophiotrema nucula TaxID=690887 RepID=A0A6A5YM86_9PLEO|nr:hypothetical protein BDV96DRAFT_504815 [Lophiotrema nucula]
MAFCCRTCNHRSHAVHSITPSTPTLLDVCIITLTYKRTPLSAANPPSPEGLRGLLNDITDSAESTSTPSRFTVWSLCSQRLNTVVIVTSASETCARATSSVFDSVLGFLQEPPSVQHVYLDYSILSLANPPFEEGIPCDLILVKAPNPGIAGAIGKRFGWDPKRSSLSHQLEHNAPVGFSRPGDLVRDFWAWAELHPGDPVSPSSSLGSYGSEYEGVLKSTNSDEKNMSLFFPEDDVRGDLEEETLVMLFQWNSRADADRFKHPLQRSVGLNGHEVANDLWDNHVAHPVRQLQGVGAKVESFKLELKGVEDRFEVSKKETRERSGSRRFSALATDLSERMSGLWR